MAKIVKLNVQIGASSKGMTAGIAAAQKSLKSLSREAKIMQRNINKAFGPVVTQGISVAGTALKAIGASAVAGAVGLGYFAKTQIDAIGDTADLADTLGLTYNQLKSIRLAAKLAGIDSEKLDAAFGKFTDTMGSAMDGNKAAIDSFARIGLSMADLERMRPDQRFNAVATAIARIPDPAQKFAAARDFFGKSGGAMVNMFENSGQAINDAGAKLEMFGSALSNLDVEKLREAGDQMDILGQLLLGAGDSLARNLAPYISQLSIDTQNWVAEMGGVGPAMDSAFGRVLDTFDRILNKMDAISEKWNNFISGPQKTFGENFAWIDRNTKNNPFRKSIESAQAEEELNRRAAMIPEHRREAFKAAARASGGFANTDPYSAGNLAEGFSGASQDRTDAATAARARIDKSESYGDSFRNWRESADAAASQRAGMAAQSDQQQAAAEAYNAKAQQIMQGAQARGFVPSRQLPQTVGPYSEQTNLLRQIAQNTGANTIAFAG